jgi:hypothetical protein
MTTNNLRLDDHYDGYYDKAEPTPPPKPTARDLCDHEYGPAEVGGMGYYIATCVKCGYKTII